MIAYLDCSSGISGDKLLGALIDLGLEAEVVSAACADVGLDARVRAERVTRGGIAAHAVTVTSTDTAWREWAVIRERLEGAPLAPAVRDGALRAFELLAQAEARAHAVPVERVHFHEVGAADTVADLLGVAIGLDRLGAERLVCSAVAVGSGTVETRHGVLPVPAPATSELLVGVPVVEGPAPVELTTPTGAALVRAHATSYGAIPPMTPARVGRGAGSRDLSGVPNIATLTLGEPLEPQGLAVGHVVVLSTAVDHISPEHAAYACERLMGASALDVWQTPLTMKKGRVGLELTVVCRPEDETALASALAHETGSLGIRIQRLERYEVSREADTAETRFGTVRVKRTVFGIRPEHEDIARIARQSGLAYADVRESVLADIGR